MMNSAPGAQGGQFLDNRIGRMIVSRSSVTAQTDAKDSAAMPGYDYEDIVNFGVHTYKPICLSGA